MNGLKFVLCASALFAFHSIRVIASLPSTDNSTYDSLDQQALLQTVFLQGHAVVSSLTEAEIQNIYGQPTAVKTSSQINKYDPQVNDLITQMVYGKYQFRLIRALHSENEFVTHFSILDDDKILLRDLKMGMTEQQIVALLGNPAISEAGRMIYEELEADAPSALVLHFLSGKLVRIDFSFYFE
ncbi:MAG: hypothetical protein DWQ05_04380 [Calditrichaeota bacterium]|nr:MAG: hypothetical protein DWQ05_04380 [Calditrichota bacterium]